MATVRSSTHPSSLSRSTKAAVQGRAMKGLFGLKNPMSGLGLRCARDVRGQTEAEPAIPAMTSRRFIRSPLRRGHELACERGRAIQLALGRAPLDRDVLALDHAS